VAEFRTSRGTPYFPTEDRLAECPVSLITSETETILNIFARAQRAYDATGISLFGPVLAEWPIWAVDALDQIRICEISENNVRVEAEAMERP